MNTAIECLPCLIRQAIDTAGRVAIPPSEQLRLMQEVLRLLGTMDLRQPAPYFGQRIQRLVREVLRDEDPYRAIKAESNTLALEWLPQLQETVRSADEPLAAAIRVAIAGNIIDYGARRDIDRDLIADAIARARAMPLDRGDLEVFRRAVAAASSILYLADNAGEIVFDRVFLECLPFEKITLGVRGGPVINDATRADASAAGLDALVKVIDSGTDIPGTMIDQCSPEFRRHFAAADMIIAKGQGNFETLTETGRPIFYLFVAKCPPIAEEVGCPVGTPVFRPMGAGRSV